MRKQIALITGLAVLTAAAGVAVTAHLVAAAGRNDPILGDMNGDRYLDRVYLGTVAPDSCSVIVEYGHAAGFDPPVA